MKSEKPDDRGCLLPVLIFFALLMSFAALMGKASSMEDIANGQMFDWIILGPLWAAVVYLCVKANAPRHSKRRAVAVGAALITWITVALVSDRMEDKKNQMRSERNRRYEKQQKERSLND